MPNVTARRRLLRFIFRQAILAMVRVATGVHLWRPPALQQASQRIYFANHTSIGDFLLIWTVLPPSQRRLTRPVAAQDYWHASWLRRFLALEVFNALLISRAPTDGPSSACQRMAEALNAGDSLIIFPEGTRNTTPAWLMPFKHGLYHLACDHPAVPLIPVWLDNARHVMPKGAWLPVPMVCTVRMGAALPSRPAEAAEAFLSRAQAAVLALRPLDHEAGLPC